MTVILTSGCVTAMTPLRVALDGGSLGRRRGLRRFLCLVQDDARLDQGFGAGKVYRSRSGGGSRLARIVGNRRVGDSTADLGFGQHRWCGLCSVGSVAV